MSDSPQESQKPHLSKIRPHGLTQTLYLMATDMRLGGCAIGITNTDLFARMTGVEFHVEGPVGQFAIGRGANSEASD
jgi:hypothetical protein